MTFTTKNMKQMNNKNNGQDRRRKTSSPVAMDKHYGHFDEAATLSTTSTLSMSSSEDYNLHIVEEEPPKIVNHANSRWSKKIQKQPKSLNSNNNHGTDKPKGKGKGKNSKRITTKRVSKATSTKTHDAPMKRRDIYFALDCEMVGVGAEGLDSALARVSIVNWDNEIVLDTYVKVDQPVTDYRTFVSGIRPEQIESESAMPLHEVRQVVTSILQGKILIGHGLKNDLAVTGIHHPWCDIRDTATYAPFMRTQESRSADEQSTLRPRKLKDLVFEKLGNQIQVMGKAHSPVEDAIAAMDLYKSVRNEWETEMMKQVNKANTADDARCGRLPMPQIRSYPEKASLMDIGRMPLFPGNQYHRHQMSYAPMPPHMHMSQYNHQSALEAARVAADQARYRAMRAPQNQMMLQPYC